MNHHFNRNSEQINAENQINDDTEDTRNHKELPEFILSLFVKYIKLRLTPAGTSFMNTRVVPYHGELNAYAKSCVSPKLNAQFATSASMGNRTDGNNP